MSQEPVIVSLCSLPTRFSQLEKALHSLKRQSLIPDRIYVWLSPHYKRLNQSLSPKELPRSLKAAAQDARAHIEWVPDRGPVTKLYPVIERCAHLNPLIVIVDDDRPLPSYGLERLVQAAREMKGACGFRGRSFGENDLRYERMSLHSAFPRYHRLPPVLQEIPVDILTATSGIAFPPGAMDSGFLNFWSEASQNAEEHPFFTDDIWISGYLAKKRIPRYVIPIPESERKWERARAFLRSACDRWRPQPPDALWEINRRNDFNDRSISDLKEVWR